MNDATISESQAGGGGGVGWGVGWGGGGWGGLYAPPFQPPFSGLLYFSKNEENFIFSPLYFCKNEENVGPIFFIKIGQNI